MSSAAEPAEAASPEPSTRRCPRCGQENPAVNRLCFCGFDFDFDVPPKPAPAPSGVAGWLLFFCVQATILAPFTAVKSFARLVGELEREQLIGAPAGLVLLGYELAEMLVMLTGVRAGVALWKVLPGALRRARIYLVTQGCVYFLMAPSWSVVPIPEGIVPPTTQGQVFAMLRAFLIPATWWLYFDRSRRVQATYLLDREAIRAFD